ncbi:DUF3592 domain-containing protein [Halorientalis marina]|uniref:DUF3592 domain-containing protein n=1 Tax=Halorientalis marina TaxID=2931976 RepID=UPI003FEDD4C9
MPLLRFTSHPPPEIPELRRSTFSNYLRTLEGIIQQFIDTAFSTLSIGTVRKWRYRPRGEVTIHYDPDRPNRAVLVPGASGSISLVLFGLGFSAFGVVFLLFPSGFTL